MTIFEDEIVNNNAFEHANLIVTELWALTNEIMLNIMQNFKSTYVLSSISETLYNFSTEFFPMYNVTSIFRKNGSVSNKTCCDLAEPFWLG